MRQKLFLVPRLYVKERVGGSRNCEEGRWSIFDFGSNQYPKCWLATSQQTTAVRRKSTMDTIEKKKRTRKGNGEKIIKKQFKVNNKRSGKTEMTEVAEYRDEIKDEFYRRLWCWNIIVTQANMAVNESTVSNVTRSISAMKDMNQGKAPRENSILFDVLKYIGMRVSGKAPWIVV